MHGCGNDFVVLDGRRAPIALDAATVRRIGDRHRGVGFDQLLLIEPGADADVALALLQRRRQRVGCLRQRHALRGAAAVRRGCRRCRLRWRWASGGCGPSACPTAGSPWRWASPSCDWRAHPAGRALRHAGGAARRGRPAAPGRGQHGQSARRLLRERPRGDRRRGAGCPARAPPDVPRARQYRLRAAGRARRAARCACSSAVPGSRSPAAAAPAPPWWRPGGAAWWATARGWSSTAASSRSLGRARGR